MQYRCMHQLADPGERGDFAAWAFVAADGGQALLNLVVTRTHANTHGIHLRLRGLDAHGRYRLAEAVVEGCERPDGRILNDAALEGRIFTGRSLMGHRPTAPAAVMTLLPSGACAVSTSWTPVCIG